MMMGGASFLKKNQSFGQTNNTNSNVSSNNNNNTSSLSSSTKTIESSHITNNNNNTNNNVSNSINYYLQNQWLNSFSSSNTSLSSSSSTNLNQHNIMTLTSPNQSIPNTKASQMYFKNINKPSTKRYTNSNTTASSSSINNESKLEKLSIQELSQQLPQIARKQIGCRFLQKLLTQSNSHSFANEHFFPHLQAHKIIDLSKDFFGNYFIQKLLPHLNIQNLTAITAVLLSDFINLSTNPHGTRVIQRLNQVISPHPTLLTQFTNTFSKHIHHLFNDQHGTFILINYVCSVAFPENNFVFSFLSQSIKEAATSSYSCCTLQKCVDIANPQQQEALLIKIAEHTHELITNQYGNYVLQFVLSKRSNSVNDVIVDNILKKIIEYAKQKYSSNVIEKCFEFCEQGLRSKIITSIRTYEVIVTLLFDMYGNYVLQKAIAYSDSETKSYFISIIIKEINKLHEFEFGQKLITKLILTFPELRLAIKQNNKEFNSNIVTICNQIESLTLNQSNQYVMMATMSMTNKTEGTEMNMSIGNNERLNMMMMNNYNSINNGFI